MAVDKLVDSTQLNADLTSVANAIRAKGGTSASLAFPAGFVSAIGDIPTGGGGNDFVVTIDWDDTQQMYVPNRTFAEIQSAYEAGKKIAVTMADNLLEDQYIADGYYTPSSGGFIPMPAKFSYMVMYSVFPNNTILYYVLNENELYNDGESNFYNTTNATALPADVASGKVFYNIDGQQTGTGSLVTVSPLSVTANGTYTAPSGTAYSPVTVNVSGGGGASNVVTGTFTGTTTGAAMDVPLNYSGSGYPIALMIYPSEGAFNANGTFYNLIKRYATWFYYSVKCYPDLIPLYTTGNNNDLASVINRYKNSSSDSKSMSNSVSTNYSIYDNNSSSMGSYTIVKIKSPQIMSVFIASASNGFAANIEYTYCVIYSE